MGGTISRSHFPAENSIMDTVDPRREGSRDDEITFRAPNAKIYQFFKYVYPKTKNDQGAKHSSSCH